MLIDLFEMFRSYYGGLGSGYYGGLGSYYGGYPYGGYSSYGKLFSFFYPFYYENEAAF